MKVFISGSKVGNDQSLPESVGLCLKKIMSDGNEILIGDCWGIDTLVQEYLSAAKYERVTVYSSGSHKKIRSNLGHWIEKWFNIDYSKFTLKQNGYRHLQLEEKKRILDKVKINNVSVCEDVDEHYNYWRDNYNPNKDDCCNLE